MKSVFSLAKAKAFVTMFWKVIPVITVLALQSIRVTPRLRHMNKFLYMIYILNSNHGSLYTVKYLKACHIAIQRYLSGNRVLSLREIEPDYPFPRLKNGLPQFILSMDRAEIRAMNPKVIRWWLSILSIYRVIEAPRKVSIETITDLDSSSYSEYAALVYRFKAISKLCFRGRTRLFNIDNLSAKHLRPSVKAGPNSSVAFQGVLLDIVSLKRYPALLEAFRNYVKFSNSTKFGELFERAVSITDRIVRFDNAFAFMLRNNRLTPLETMLQSECLLKYPEVFVEYNTNEWENSQGVPRRSVNKITEPGSTTSCEPGRLVGIPEPAGKMRIIAICDMWTQSLLAPLHKCLFSFLRTLPNDGTFDQNAAFDRAVRKGQESSGIWCADLSAATDRLPIKLQISILKYLFGNGIGDAWGALFTERPFIVREPILNVPANTKVSYGTGQPMGCLSSWAMLAVTHHFIVQACCVNLGWSKHVWHTCYEVLGDDIVIFDKDVYTEYVRVMTELGVKTNPNKSIISDKGIKVLEFAKRTSLEGVEISGLSWKQLASTARWRDIIPLILSLGDRQLISSHGILIRLLKFNMESFRKDAKLPRADSEWSKHMNNLVFSLLNHFSHLGMMDLKSTYAYVVDTRMSNEGFSFGKIPLTTAVCDLFEMFKSLPSFREVGYFDISKIRLNALEFREHLVGAKLLPFWGHNLDAEIIRALEKFRYAIPDFPQTLVHSFINHPRVYWQSKWNNELSVEILRLSNDIANDLVYQGKDDYTRFNELQRMLVKNLSLTDRDFETSLNVHSELNLFVIKYRFINELLQSKAVEIRDAVPWPMKEVREAVLASNTFDSMKEELGVSDIRELTSDQRLLFDFLSTQETFVLCEDFEFEE